MWALPCGRTTGWGCCVVPAPGWQRQHCLHAAATVAWLPRSTQQLGAGWVGLGGSGGWVLWRRGLGGHRGGGGNGGGVQRLRVTPGAGRAGCAGGVLQLRRGTRLPYGRVGWGGSGWWALPSLGVRGAMDAGASGGVVQQLRAATGVGVWRWTFQVALLGPAGMARVPALVTSGLLPCGSQATHSLCGCFGVG